MNSPLDEVHEYLDSLLVFGVKLGLRNMEALCSLLGQPQEDLSFVHVAGTNGKGSTCSMLAAALKNCGLKTAFYSSPFLYRFTERWRINGEEVTEEAVARAVGQVRVVEDELVLQTGVRPTYFEVLTVAALLIFKEAQVDVVVWETGLGGRLDATNVVTPLLSIITNIDLDHTQYLGETLLEIAYEKGGIVKKGIPFICGDRQLEIQEYFSKLSEEKEAPLIMSSSFDVVNRGLQKIDGRLCRQMTYKSASRECQLELGDVGLYQLDNAGVALAALEVLEKIIPLDFERAVAGLEKFKWPGRMELRSESFILDGAHNPLGARATIESLKEIYPDKKFHFICGILKDKDWREVIDIFLPSAKSFYFVNLESERSSESEDLQAHALSQGGSVSGCGSVSLALSQMAKSDINVVVGSLYLIGEFLAILNNGEAVRIDRLA